MPHVLVAVVEHLKKLCRAGDPRMNNPRVLEQVRTLSKDMQAILTVAQEKRAWQEQDTQESLCHERQERSAL